MNEIQPTDTGASTGALAAIEQSAPPVATAPTVAPDYMALAQKRAAKLRKTASAASLKTVLNHLIEAGCGVDTANTVDGAGVVITITGIALVPSVAGAIVFEGIDGN